MNSVPAPNVYEVTIVDFGKFIADLLGPIGLAIAGFIAFEIASSTAAFLTLVSWALVAAPLIAIGLLVLALIEDFQF